jgi:hypothetical protein
MKTEPTNKPREELGQIFREDSLVTQELEFLYETADHRGNLYKFYLGEITRSPVVYSCATGKYFILPWPQILELAVERGIDAPSLVNETSPEQSSPQR